MSGINEYLINNARANVQEIIDSAEKSLTIMVGVVSIGPIALFVLSTLANPYLSLSLPIFVTITVFIVRRIFMKFRSRLNRELLRAMKPDNDFIGGILGGEGSVLMNMLGIDDLRKWFYLLKAMNNEQGDFLISLLQRELQGDLSSSEIILAKYMLAIRYSSDKITISALKRGLRTIMLGYYILLFSIPAVAKSLQFLGVHWNVMFILMIQTIISITLFFFLRILRRDFDVDVDMRLFFTVVILSILMGLILLK